jgi:outer membrane protein TolC
VVKTAIASETHSRTRYQQGLASFLDLLNVQQSRFDAELSLIRVKVNQLTNRITLGLALGIGA